MPFLGSLNHANGLQIDNTCVNSNSVTLLGYGTSNKLLEATFLTFTGNGSSTRTVGSTIKRYVIHINGLQGGGNVTCVLTWNVTASTIVTASVDAIVIFDVT